MLSLLWEHIVIRSIQNGEQMRGGWAPANCGESRPWQHSALSHKYIMLCIWHPASVSYPNRVNWKSCYHEQYVLVCIFWFKYVLMKACYVVYDDVRRTVWNRRWNSYSCVKCIDHFASVDTVFLFILHFIVACSLKMLSVQTNSFTLFSKHNIFSSTWNFCALFRKQC